MKKYILAGTLVLSIVLSGTDSFANNIQPIKAETYIGKSLDLRDVKGYYKGNTQMIPLRNVAENKLGFEIIWNSEEKSIELKRDAQWSSIKIGENSYFFAKTAPFELSQAPELKDGSTFVPVEFFSQVLKYDILTIEVEDKGIEIIKKEHKDNQDIKYPRIQGMKGELTEAYINQGIEGFVNSLKDNEHFEDLRLDYEITFLNDEKISIVFGGTYKMNKDAEKYLTRSLNIDLKSSNEITFENYFKDDKASQEKLMELLDKAAEERGLSKFEAEGRWIKFKGSNVIVFYYPLDDSVTVPVELYLSLEEIKDIINDNFGERPAS